MAESPLPEGFADLAPFVAWALPTETSRSRKRLSSSIEEIRAFYDAMVARGEAALAHLRDAEAAGGAPLSAPEERLLHLLFALAEVAPAVEVFGQPAVIDGFEAARFVPEHDSAEWARMRERRAAAGRGAREGAR